MFDSAGRYVTAFGRRGHGPGEFVSAVVGVLVGPGDTVHVFDARGLLYLFAPTLRFVRSVRLDGRYLTSHGFVLRDGRLLLNTQITTPDRIGWPMHVLDRHGQAILSFGADRPIVTRGSTDFFRAVAIAPGDSAVWIAQTRVYTMSRWGLDGRKRLEVEVVDIPWMAPPPEMSGDARSSHAMPPAGSGAGVAHEDRDGHLWVFGTVPDPKWQPTTPSSQPTVFSLAMMQSRIDQMVDVYDTRTWTLLVSQRFDDRAECVQGCDLVYTKHEQADGIITIDVWRQVLRSQHRNQGDR